MSWTNKISGNEGKLDVPLSRSYHRKPRGAAVQQRLRSLALRVFNNQYHGFQWSACTHTSRDRQKHTMNFNNLNTIGRITVHSTFVKLFGIRDHYWENNSKTVEKIAFCLLGTTTWHFLFKIFFSFLFNLHAFTDFPKIHLLAYTTTLLKQLTNKNTIIKMVATRLCKREDLRCKPCHLSVLAISCK